MRAEADTAAVDRSDLQGNILRGYGFPFAAYLFARVDDERAGRGWLGRLLPSVTTAEPWRGPKPATTLNLAFTYAGLQALGVADDVLASAPDDFRAGMAGRAGQLGDGGRHAPEHWDEGLGSGAAHVLAMINAQQEGDLDAACESLRGGVPDGVAIVHEQRAAVLEGNREHWTP